MVRFSRVWRAVLRMGHPQVRWSVWLMTQNGGMPAQLQGDGEGVEALPLNWVECGKSHHQPRPRFTTRIRLAFSRTIWYRRLNGFGAKFAASSRKLSESGTHYHRRL